MMIINDVMRKCENMKICGRPIIFFIFAYQILMTLKMKATPKGWGLPHVKRYEAGTLARKRKEWAGTPAREKEMYMAGTPARKRKEWRGLSQKKKKCAWRGLPQMNDDMVGTPTRKGLGLQQCTGLRI